MKDNNYNNNNQLKEISDEMLLRLVDAGMEGAGTEAEEFRSLLASLSKTKENILPSKEFGERLIAALPVMARAGTASGKVEIKSPYGERFAWLGAVMSSPWKIATPIAVLLIVFGAAFKAHPAKEAEMPLAQPMMTAIKVESADVAPEKAAGNATAPLDVHLDAPLAARRMMMTVPQATSKKVAPPVPSSASAVIAMLSSEADADANTQNSSSDVTLLSIDPTSVNDLNQTYDAAIN